MLYSPVLVSVASLIAKALFDLSISLNMQVLFDYAEVITNNLWPVVGISAGFTLGFGILAMVVSAISKAVRTS